MCAMFNRIVRKYIDRKVRVVPALTVEQQRKEQHKNALISYTAYTTTGINKRQITTLHAVAVLKRKHEKNAPLPQYTSYKNFLELQSNAAKDRGPLPIEQNQRKEDIEAGSWGSAPKMGNP